MEGIEFEEQKQNYASYQRMALLPSLVIRYSRGKIETEKEANLTLLVITVIIFLISMFIAFSGGNNDKNPTLDTAKKTEIEKTAHMNLL